MRAPTALWSRAPYIWRVRSDERCDRSHTITELPARAGGGQSDRYLGAIPSRRSRSGPSGKNSRRKLKRMSVLTDSVDASHMRVAQKASISEALFHCLVNRPRRGAHPHALGAVGLAKRASLAP